MGNGRRFSAGDGGKVALSPQLLLLLETQRGEVKNESGGNRRRICHGNALLFRKSKERREDRVELKWRWEIYFRTFEHKLLGYIYLFC